MVWILFNCVNIFFLNISNVYKQYLKTVNAKRIFLTAFNWIKHVTKIKCRNVPLRIEFKKQKVQRGAVIDYTLHVTSCYVGANQRGRWGEQNRAENEQIQRQGKQSKRSSEVRTQRHCVCTTIEADPTATTGPSSENTAAARAHILTAQNQSSWRSRPAWRKICFHVKLNAIIKQTKKAVCQLIANSASPL